MEIAGAERWPAAFGRYLRVLRERRSLSLTEVAGLASQSAEPVDKGTLSRFEHGKQRIPASKLVPLSRIYGISGGALLERLELDMELDRVGSDSLVGENATDVLEKGIRALSHHGNKWLAYAAFRDVAFRHLDSLPDSEDHAVALTNHAMAIRSIGKNRLALHEFQELERVGATAERRHAVLLDRMSNCYRCLGDFHRAESYATEAIRESDSFDERRILAFAHASAAAVALDQGDHTEGVHRLQAALHANLRARKVPHLVAPNPSFEVGTLLKLAEASCHLGWADKARRTADAAKRRSLKCVIPGGLGYSELILGELDDVSGKRNRALQRWQRASDIGNSIHDRRLSFAAEFYTYRSTRRHGEKARARATAQRLDRLAPWVPEHFPALLEYREQAGTRT